MNDYAFDPSGNTTRDAQFRKFTYDAENKQIDVKNASNETIGQYWHDGDGRRVKKRGLINGQWEETIFVYDASSKLVAEYSTILNETPQVAYLSNDHLGSPRINTNENGAVISRHDYRPYGEEITERPHSQYATDTLRKQFTGYERDNETDLDFAQARYFDSLVGRFIVPDSFLNDTVAVDPSGWNLFAYARNRPTIIVDSSGERVYVGGLSASDQSEVVRRMNFTYGCTNCVSVDKDGFLAVDTSTLNSKIRSATQKLTDALNSTSWLAEVQVSNNDSSVAFGQGRPTRGALPGPNGGRINADLIVLDFHDDEYVSGDATVRDAFLNTVLAHEILHFTLAPGQVTPDPVGDPSKTGKVVDAVNEILYARGLPLRERYLSSRDADYWLLLHHGEAQLDKSGVVERNKEGGIKVKANDTKKIVQWLKRNVGGSGVN